jgi:hypothetical protein
LINVSTQRCYRLAPRGGAGLACDEEGLALGAGMHPVGRPGTGGIIAVPNAVVPPLVGGILGAVAGGLHAWDVGRAQQAMNNAISHLKLDPDRPGDQTAAMAYVWSNHFLPLLIPALPYEAKSLTARRRAVNP